MPGNPLTITLEISKSELEDCNRILVTGKKLAVKNDVMKTFTVSFPDGYEADIKLCNGEPPFVDAVLFNQGQEVARLDSDSNRIEGEYTFDAQHQVIIK
jgi:hypothetical protein